MAFNIFFPLLCDVYLVADKWCQREQPFPALHFADTQASRALYINMPQRVAARKTYDKIDTCFFLLVCSNDFVSRSIYANWESFININRFLNLQCETNHCYGQSDKLLFIKEWVLAY
jgi:hypothetical protein